MIILENDMTMFEQQLMESNFAGTVALSKIRRYPNSVLIANEGRTNYVAAQDVETFMEANSMIDAAAAVREIAKANCIATESMVVVVDENTMDVNIESLREAGIVLERAAEADSTTLNKAMKWYGNFLQKSKGKAESKEILKNRIEVLKKCEESMEKELDRAKKGSKSGAIKYAIKNIIPFNSVVRLIKNDDIYAGLGMLAGYVVSFVGNIIVSGIMKKDFNKAMIAANMSNSASLGAMAGIRYSNYEKMLERAIKNTKEAIDYLEDKLKDWKD